MKISANHIAIHVQLRRRMLKHLDREPRRLSMYRMFRSREFHELCEYYLEGIGIRRFDQFMEYALRLEKTFEFTPLPITANPASPR